MPFGIFQNRDYGLDIVLGLFHPKPSKLTQSAGESVMVTTSCSGRTSQLQRDENLPHPFPHWLLTPSLEDGKTGPITPILQTRKLRHPDLVWLIGLDSRFLRMHKGTDSDGSAYESSG